MDDKVEFKKILSVIIKGDLSCVVYSLKKLKNINNKILTNTLAALCQLVGKQPNNIDVNDLKHILIFCCESITNPNESETLNYLQAEFHLLKFLSRKIPFPDIVKLFSYILPKNGQSSKEIEEIYIHLNVLLHNEIIIPISKTNDINTLMKSLNYSIELYQYVFHRNPSAFFSKIYTYTKLIQSNKKECVQFCTSIIKSFKTKEINVKDDINKEVYTSIMFLIYVLLSNVEESEIIDLAFGILEKFCIKDEYKLYVETFQLFHRLFYKQDTNNEIFERINKNFNKILKNYGINSSGNIIMDYILRLLRNSKFDEFKKIDKNSWSKIMSVDLQLNYMKLFQIIGYMLSLSKYSDKCSDYCELKQNYIHAVVMSNMSVSLYGFSIQHDQVDKLDNIAYGCLKDCSKYIEKLKGSNCEKWLSIWRMVGQNVYNMALKFYRQNNFNYALKYYKVFCKYVVMFEGVEKTNICIDNALGLSLSLLGQTYMNLDQYRKALTYLAFGIYICPEMRNKLWHSWCSVKSKAGNDNISELTISDILCNDIEVIKTIYPGYVYESDKMNELLMLELESYSEIWSSKTPMNATSKQLLKTCTDLTQRTIVLHLVAEKIKTLQDEDFIKNLEITIDKLNKNKKDLSNQICLSVLYFIDFQYKLHVILKKNLTEMNEAVAGENVISGSAATYDEFTTNNDHCDIIPNLYNNKIENIFQLHKILSKSMEIWLKMINNPSLLKSVELIEKLNLENYIKLMAYEYRLQNIRSESIKCWYVYLHLGLLLSKPDMIVTSIGFIVESCGCYNKEIIKLIKKAEEYIKQLKSSSYNELIINYYINKSTGFLLSNQLEEGLKDLNKSKELLSEIPVQKSKIFESRIFYLTSQYLRKSCSSNLIEHNQNYILLLQNSFITIADYYKLGGNRCSFTLSILFDISLSISWTYRWLRMAREVRCYTAEVVLLAQQMVLPIRTSQLLSVLSFIDLFNCQYDDCNVKLTGLNYILCYNTSKTPKICTDSKEQEKLNEVIVEFDSMSISAVDNPIEMMLDVPVNHNVLNTRGSPVLNTNSFKMPMFITHFNCDCFYCLNIDYQKIIFEHIHLEAMFYLKQTNYVKSLEFFKGGLQYFDYIYKKLDYFKKLKELEYSVDLYKKQLKETYSLFLMDYSFYFIKYKNYDEANNILNKIIKTLGDDIKYNPYFHTELLMLKINLITAKKQKIQEETTKILITENSLQTNLQKTPENKVSFAKISPTITISDESFPVKQPNKNIRMNIFESDDEIDEKKSPKPDKYKLKSPVKTPEMNLKLATPMTRLKPNKENDNKDDKSKLLLKRTRLLTSKLKAETKTVLQPLENIEINTKEIKSTKQNSSNETKIKKPTTKTRELKSNELTTKTNELTTKINELTTKTKELTTKTNETSTKTNELSTESKTNSDEPCPKVKSRRIPAKKDANPVNTVTRSTRSRRLDK